MKRFAWIAVLSGVALIVTGCSSEKPAPKPDAPADTPTAEKPEMDIDVEIDVPVAPPADVAKPTEAMPEPAPAEPPAAEPPADDPKPDAAAAGKSKVHKAVGNALLKAVTGSTGKPADDAPAFKP